MYIQISSTNPSFSYVISKHPDSPMLINAIKKGYGFGWYTPDTTQKYNLFFNDNTDEVSFNYQTQGYEYLDRSRYVSPFSCLKLFREFLNDAFKHKHEHDEHGHDNKVFINMCAVDMYKYIIFFDSHFEDFSIKHKHVNANNYRLTFESNKPLHDLFNYVLLFCMFAVIINKHDDFYISEEDVEKYLLAIEVVNAPYFIRYLFKLHFLRNIKRQRFYDYYKERLDTDEISLVPGNTWLSRFEFIYEHLNLLGDVVDFGCGEGKYATRLIKKLQTNNNYYGIDIDKNARKVTAKKLRNKQLTNFEVYNSVETFLNKEYDIQVTNTQKGFWRKIGESLGLVNESEINIDRNIELICSEVIEHMSYKQAHKLLKFFNDIGVFNQILITTPNKSFNVNYTLNNEPEDRLRNDGHSFELTKDEFMKLLYDSFDYDRYNVQYKSVGDIVKDEPITHGAVVKLKK